MSAVANTTPTTLASFAVWLTTSQQAALDAMRATTGEAFGQHCDNFAELATAIKVLRAFEQHAAAPASASQNGGAV